MLRTLWTAAKGMQAQTLTIDVISNNLANVNTTGFKKSRAEFQDLLYETSRMPGVTSSSGNQVPTGIQVGYGSRPVATQKLFTQGNYKNTDNKLDLAIEGDGFSRSSSPTARSPIPGRGPSRSTARAGWSPPTASSWIRRSPSPRTP